MSKDRNDFNNISDQDYSVEDILAEFSSSQEWEEDFGVPKKGPVPVTRECHTPAPVPTRAHKTTRQPHTRAADKPEKPSRAVKKEKGEKAEKGNKNVIHFPVSAKEKKKAPAIDKLAKKSPIVANVIKKADRYADHMFEDAEPSPEDVKAQRYIPGVDVERAGEDMKHSSPRRRNVRQWPDTPPEELAAEYGKGLDGLRIRRILLFALMVPLLYLHLAPSFSFPLPAVVMQNTIRVWICAGFQLAALGLSYDLVISGLTRLGADTLTVLAAFFTLADACTMNFLHARNGNLPYTLVSMLALALGLWGKHMKLSTLRASCRTAQSVKRPYVVTLDEDKWDGRPTFSKWSGTIEGFGSQIQSDDGAMRLFRGVSCVFIPACLLFSLISSLGKGRPELLIWCLSATMCSCASLAGALSFPLPGRLLSRRLARAGAALAGWEGIRRQSKGSGVLLTDTDLFPPGSISLNGVKVFQNHPLDKVIAITATMIHEMGSGLDRTFYELLHSQGVTYRKVDQIKFYEGGASAVIRGEQILVGNVSFMHMMDVPITQGRNVKNAVFCAINGELAGIFALNYSLHVSIRPALYSLIENRIPPILATRDFNLLPSMLHHRFKLPAGKTQFPSHDRRRELSAPDQKHDHPLVCVLCREGIAPLAEAIVGAKRLNTATRLNAVLAVVGSAIGLLLTFYLTAQTAFTSLSVFNMFVFLLMWLVPTLLISSWVARY